MTARATVEDDILQKIIKIIITGWLEQHLANLYQFENQLLVVDGFA